MAPYSASTAVSPLKSKIWTKSETSIASEIYPTTALSAISCGRTPQTTAKKGSTPPPEAQGIAGVMTSLINSSTTTIWRWYAGPINWLWTGTPTHTRRNAWQYFPHPIIAIGAGIRLPLWRWGIVWNITTRNMSHRRRRRKASLRGGCRITSCEVICSISWLLCVGLWVGIWMWVYVDYSARMLFRDDFFFPPSAAQHPQQEIIWGKRILFK